MQIQLAVQDQALGFMLKRVPATFSASTLGKVFLFAVAAILINVAAQPGTAAAQSQVPNPIPRPHKPPGASALLPAPTASVATAGGIVDRQIRPWSGDYSSWTVQNLNHATSAVVALRKRPARIERDQACLLSQPRVPFVVGVLPEFCLLASNHCAAVDAHYHLSKLPCLRGCRPSPLHLPQPHARPVAVILDEDHAGYSGDKKMARARECRASGEKRSRSPQPPDHSTSSAIARRDSGSVTGAFFGTGSGSGIRQGGKRAHGPVSQREACLEARRSRSERQT